MLLRLITICTFFITIGSTAQIPVGAWRDHLSYNNVLAVEAFNNQIIALTNRALFIHNTTDGTNKRITKVEGLSGVQVSCLGVHPVNGTIIIGYDNGFFDVIVGNDIASYSDIDRSNLLGDVAIKSVFMQGDKAYLATGFGIVLFDLNKREIKETYFIADNAAQEPVNDLLIFNNKIYATTNTGIKYADVNQVNLTDFRNWKQDTLIPNSAATFNHLTVFNNQLFVNYVNDDDNAKDTIYYHDGANWITWLAVAKENTTEVKSVGNKLIVSRFGATFVYDQNLSIIKSVWSYETDPVIKYSRANSAVITNDHLWIADKNEGVVKWHLENDLQGYVFPGGPTSNDVVQIKMFNDNLWAAGGAVSGSWNNAFSGAGFFSFVDEQWKNYAPSTYQPISGTYDFITTVIDPQDPKHTWIGSWGKGLREFRNGEMVNHYDNTNSTLDLDVNRTDIDLTKVSGLTYDADGNLWISNPQNLTPLKVLTPAGEWYEYDLGGAIEVTLPTSEIIISEAGYKWIIRPRKKGMIVFDDNGTLDNVSDDRVKEINTEVGFGELPSLSVNAARLDLDGELWLGTSEGLAIFYAPDEVFDNEEFRAEQILIEQDGNVQILLETEVITTIEIDGANRKWIGTQASGVFLLSADGVRQVHHFTSENSPLLDNEIKDVTLNHGNGEVYIATSKGIVSFKGTATTGLLENSKPFVYPNPVPPGYDGVIAVKNLVANSFFKVTDIAGNMIFEGQTEGGQAVWNGKNYMGEKVETGVYLFLITNDTGKETSTAKVLITR